MTLRLLAAALLLLGVAGCTAESEPSPTRPSEQATTTSIPPTTTTTLVPGPEAFRGCMANNGVLLEPIPIDARGRPRLDLVFHGLSLDGPVVSAALAACSGHLTTGNLELGPDAELREMVLEALGDYVACVRERGVPDFPDVVEGFDGVGPPFPADRIPYGDPDLATATERCRRLIAG